MKVMLNILLVIVCFSTFSYAKALDSSTSKTVKSNGSAKVASIKFSQGYGEYSISEGTVERKRSHKRRKAVRKPRRGRGQ